VSLYGEKMDLLDCSIIFCMLLVHHFFISLNFMLNAFRKQCIQTYNVYDFLREVVSKVPDIGPSDVIADDKLGKRR
jgi:hypothetical protein